MIFSARTGKIATPQAQAGLSLVELLIASVLSLIIVAALTQLFADIARSNREMTKTNSQIENARFAMQLLRNDIVHAGFWGSYVPLYDDFVLNDVPPQIPADPTDPYDAGSVPDQFYDPCLAYASWNTAYVNYLIGMPLLVYDNVPPGCAGVVTDRVANTDVLVVRHADTCIAGQPGCDPVSATLPYFLATNCSSQLSASPPLFYAVGENFDPTAATTPRERDCTAVAQRRLIQHIYYVQDTGDGIPTLVRSELGVDSTGTIQQLPPVPLVSGVERLHFVVGLDNVSEVGGTDLVRAVYQDQVVWSDPDDWQEPTNRGDGNPDEFRRCTVASCDEDDFINVVAVRVYILARADESTPGYNDSKTYDLGGLTVAAPNDEFKRHVFSSTIRINNVAGRRETP